MFELYYLNIAKYFLEELKGTPGTIIMSATLHPESFYKILFGLGPEVPYLVLKNYFPIEHRLTLVIKDIKTRYADLIDQNNLRFITEQIESIYSAKEGRYLFFVPNLELVNEIVRLLKPTNKYCFSQFEEEPLKHFEKGIFVCALGSIFSEGVNIPNLTGVIILSPGIPPPSYRNSLLQEYYKFKAVNGSSEESFNLTYRVPGLNKILQASGRLHRSSDDKGCVILLGERFNTDYYQNLFPEFLQPVKITTHDFITHEINSFWSKFKN